MLKSYQLYSTIQNITRKFLSNNNELTKDILYATGGTISSPGDGYTYHTFTAPGTFSITLGIGNVEMVSIGAGGGGGGVDIVLLSPVSGGGGGGGGISLGTFPLTPTSLVVSVGGGGGGGSGPFSGAGGVGGTNGGGTGGNAGPSGASAGGGGGGGWSGISTGSTYYVVGGGAAGGGGAAEGPANNQAALGGGVPTNTYSTITLTGAAGNPYPTDGGGYGGSGGGFNGASGGGGTGGTTMSGGSNYANPIGITETVYAGGNGAFPNDGTAGSRAPGFLPANPGWAPVIPATAGNGGTGPSGAGSPGIVIIRYLSGN